MKTLSTKVPSELLERIDRYADSIGETRSVAARRLLRAGLEAETEPGRVPVPFVGIYLGTVLFVAAFADADPEVGTAGLVIAVAAFIVSRPTFQQGVARLKSRYTG